MKCQNKNFAFYSTLFYKLFHELISKLIQTHGGSFHYLLSYSYDDLGSIQVNLENKIKEM